MIKCYYINAWNSPVLKTVFQNEDGTDFGVLNSNKIYNSTGQRIYVRRPDPNNPNPILDYSSLLNNDFSLNETKYQQQGPFYLTDMFAISYFTSFMTIAAGFKIKC